MPTGGLPPFSSSPHPATAARFLVVVAVIRTVGPFFDTDPVCSVPGGAALERVDKLSAVHGIHLDQKANVQGIATHILYVLCTYVCVCLEGSGPLRSGSHVLVT